MAAVASPAMTQRRDVPAKRQQRKLVEAAAKATAHTTPALVHGRGASLGRSKAARRSPAASLSLTREGWRLHCTFTVHWDLLLPRPPEPPHVTGWSRVSRRRRRARALVAQTRKSVCHESLCARAARGPPLGARGGTSAGQGKEGTGREGARGAPDHACGLGLSRACPRGRALLISSGSVGARPPPLRGSGPLD